jgi:hypothetical protein
MFSKKNYVVRVVQKTKKLPQHGAAGVFLLGLLYIAMD